MPAYVAASNISSQQLQPGQQGDYQDTPYIPVGRPGEQSAALTAGAVPQHPEEFELEEDELLEGEGAVCLPPAGAGPSLLATQGLPQGPSAGRQQRPRIPMSSYRAAGLGRARYPPGWSSANRGMPARLGPNRFRSNAPVRYGQQRGLGYGSQPRRPSPVFVEEDQPAAADLLVPRPLSNTNMEKLRRLKSFYPPGLTGAQEEQQMQYSHDPALSQQAYANNKKRSLIKQS